MAMNRHACQLEQQAESLQAKPQVTSSENELGMVGDFEPQSPSSAKPYFLKLSKWHHQLGTKTQPFEHMGHTLLQAITTSVE